MHLLALNANPQGWRTFISRKNNSVFQTIAQTIFDRDQFECQYCGSQIPDAQEVINVNGDYSQNEPSNLVTACGLCTQCGFLESVGGHGYGGGTLIYLPELSQEGLNGFCYALFKALSQETEASETAQQYYRSLSRRAQLVEDQLGVGMSEPSVFGQLLIESGSTIKANTFLSHVKLLPSRAAFKKEITAWLTHLKE